MDLNRSPTISGPPSPGGQQPSPPSSVPTLPNSQPDAESNEDIDTNRFDFDDVPHDVSSLGQPSAFYGDNISESEVNDFKLKKLVSWNVLFSEMSLPTCVAISCYCLEEMVKLNG